MGQMLTNGTPIIGTGVAASVEAAVLAKLEEGLVAAANEIAMNAKRYAPVDTGQLQRNIHVVLPGQSDPGTGEVQATGLHAQLNEAYVVARTHRDPKGAGPRNEGDYAYYQENGPASAEEPMGRHYLLKAVEDVDGKYEGIEIGDIASVAELGG